VRRKNPVSVSQPPRSRRPRGTGGRKEPEGITEISDRTPENKAPAGAVDGLGEKKAIKERGLGQYRLREAPGGRSTKPGKGVRGPLTEGRCGRHPPGGNRGSLKRERVPKPRRTGQQGAYKPPGRPL